MLQTPTDGSGNGRTDTVLEAINGATHATDVPSEWLTTIKTERQNSVEMKKTFYTVSMQAGGGVQEGNR